MAIYNEKEWFKKFENGNKFLKFNEEASQVRFLNYFIWIKYKSVWILYQFRIVCIYWNDDKLIHYFLLRN